MFKTILHPSFTNPNINPQQPLIHVLSNSELSITCLSPSNNFLCIRGKDLDKMKMKLGAMGIAYEK
jgi:hypothetical protein